MKAEQKIMKTPIKIFRKVKERLIKFSKLQIAFMGNQAWELTKQFLIKPKTKMMLEQS